MSSNHGDQKKRPQPVNIPPLPLPPPAPIPTSIQPGRRGPQQQYRHQQNDARNANGDTLLTSPLEQDSSHFARSQPQSGKSYDSSMTGTSNLANPTRVSSRRSDYSSRHSERSQHSSAAAQAQWDSFDVKTTRGQIESRNEQKLFKMTGQLPPTPTTGICCTI